MHLLPILWSNPPTDADWAALSAARSTAGHTEQIRPARAVHGSPGRILALGTHPDWVCEYAMVEDLTDSVSLALALGWCLGLNEYDNTPAEEEQLSRMMGCTITLKSVEEIYD